MAFVLLASLLEFAGLVHAQTKCVDGLAGEFACNNVDLLSHMPMTELGGLGSGADSWGWKDLQTGRYYAIMARSSMTNFVDPRRRKHVTHISHTSTLHVPNTPEHGRSLQYLLNIE